MCVLMGQSGLAKPPLNAIYLEHGVSTGTAFTDSTAICFGQLQQSNWCHFSATYVRNAQQTQCTVNGNTSTIGIEYTLVPLQGYTCTYAYSQHIQCTVNGNRVEMCGMCTIYSHLVKLWFDVMEARCYRADKGEWLTLERNVFVSYKTVL